MAEEVKEWNVPIDAVQADCMSLRSLIRGWVAQAKERAERWEPRPCPSRRRDVPTNDG